VDTEAVLLSDSVLASAFRRRELRRRVFSLLAVPTLASSSSAALKGSGAVERNGQVMSNGMASTLSRPLLRPLPLLEAVELCVEETPAADAEAVETAAVREEGGAL